MQDLIVILILLDENIDEDERGWRLWYGRTG
jgi:hypothetical protein